MFSSLASYLFGSNNSATDTNSEKETTENGSGVQDLRYTVDDENTIEVTSLTPSVTGAGDRSVSGAVEQRAIRRGKNRRNNTRQQNKRKGAKSTTKSPDGTNKLVTKSSPSDSCDEDLDEDEWYIVEKEEDDHKENVSTPTRRDNEGDNIAPRVEIVKSVKQPTIAPSPLAQQRRLQHINSHSLYSGPRPQKQRNYLQKSRGNTNSRNSGLSVSTLSPSRIVNDSRNAGANGTNGVTADGGMTRSLYVAPSVTPPQQQKEASSAVLKLASTVNGNAQKMDESWFVTPPPCFTSIGPINMETSPYENLLIEHPSMSVYHSIKTVQENANESFVKLDLGVKEKSTAEERKEKKAAKENVPRKQNTQAVQQRPSAGFRLDRQSVAQLKQELLARTVQMTQSKMERKEIRRSAIKRSNKAREFQSKNHTSRRSDRQHFKIVSSANNNRKCAC